MTTSVFANIRFIKSPLNAGTSPQTPANLRWSWLRFTIGLCAYKRCQLCSGIYVYWY